MQKKTIFFRIFILLILLMYIGKSSNISALKFEGKRGEKTETQTIEFKEENTGEKKEEIETSESILYEIEKEEKRKEEKYEYEKEEKEGGEGEKTSEYIHDPLNIPESYETTLHIQKSINLGKENDASGSSSKEIGEKEIFTIPEKKQCILNRSTLEKLLIASDLLSQINHISEFPNEITDISSLLSGNDIVYKNFESQKSNFINGEKKFFSSYLPDGFIAYILWKNSIEKEFFEAPLFTPSSSKNFFSLIDSPKKNFQLSINKDINIPLSEKKIYYGKNNPASLSPSFLSFISDICSNNNGKFHCKKNQEGYDLSTAVTHMRKQIIQKFEYYTQIHFPNKQKKSITPENIESLLLKEIAREIQKPENIFFLKQLCGGSKTGICLQKIKSILQKQLKKYTDTIISPEKIYSGNHDNEIYFLSRTLNGYIRYEHYLNTLGEYKDTLQFSETGSILSQKIFGSEEQTLPCSIHYFLNPADEIDTIAFNHIHSQEEKNTKNTLGKKFSKKIAINIYDSIRKNNEYKDNSQLSYNHISPGLILHADLKKQTCSDLPKYGKFLNATQSCEWECEPGYSKILFNGETEYTCIEQNYNRWCFLNENRTPKLFNNPYPGTHGPKGCSGPGGIYQSGATITGQTGEIRCVSSPDPIPNSKCGPPKDNCTFLQEHLKNNHPAIQLGSHVPAVGAEITDPNTCEWKCPAGTEFDGEKTCK